MNSNSIRCVLNGKKNLQISKLNVYKNNLIVAINYTHYYPNYELILSNLYPEKEYYVCLSFLIDNDFTKRKQMILITEKNYRFKMFSKYFLHAIHSFKNVCTFRQI